ncbi:MAG TPA: M14 metallopeptidase family protein [Longimicrobiales bacterium]
MLGRTVSRPLALLPALLLVAGATALEAQTDVTTPIEQFGHPIGADYVLPDYDDLVAYWKKLDAESDRMKLVSIGKTAEGRDQYMAIITSPENHANLAHYKEISQRLARAEGLTDEEAHRLAREGKAVVWIDGGLHASEVLGAQQLMETVYQLVSRTDPETMRILNDVIILAVQANPDGMQLVSNWYMREEDPARRSTRGLPRLYQKYVGHDNNRDFYMSTQPETENMNRILFHEWFPQIMYNHHQTGPRGMVLFAPPFRDPFNYKFDPLVVTELDLVGAAMHTRFIAEDKPGATMAEGASYSTWWNGGLRTITYFHNMIGLLTETIGNPTPMAIPFVVDRQLPNADQPMPIGPRDEWHFRQSIDYSVTANYAVLDLASRYREMFLYNIYRMGRNSIERGSRDHWTMYPDRIAKVEAAVAAAREAAGDGGEGFGFGGRIDDDDAARYMAMLHDPALRDPRGYIIPADQPDFPTATKFVNALLETGITVHRATADFTVNGKTYPAGSYVIKAAQAFRPHVLDMFEPQDYPNDFRYPGGPPIAPYDNAGWTLAYQMGIEFDRILEGFDGPFEEIDEWNIDPPPGTVEAGPAEGYILSPYYNDAFVAVNRLLADDAEVYRLAAPWQDGGERFAAGSFYIPAEGGTRARLERLATELGIDFDAVSSAPDGEAYRLHPVRIGLWDRYGGSIPSGWTRWIMEQFEFPFEVVYPQRLDEGDLRDDFDVLIFVDGAIPEEDRDRSRSFDDMAERIPEEYRHTLGEVTIEKTVPQLREFLEDGGTILTIGSSTILARHLGLPVGDKLVETGDDGREHPLPREEYYIPGSVLEVRVDTRQPIAWGMDDHVDVFFDNSPVFTLEAGAEASGLERVAWFDGPEPLRSGWAWGQNHLEGGLAVIEAPVGEGTLYLFGPEILNRAQPHGTFKFFFNGLTLSTAERESID